MVAETLSQTTCWADVSLGFDGDLQANGPSGLCAQVDSLVADSAEFGTYAVRLVSMILERRQPHRHVHLMVGFAEPAAKYTAKLVTAYPECFPCISSLHEELSELEAFAAGPWPNEPQPGLNEEYFVDDVTW